MNFFLNSSQTFAAKNFLNFLILGGTYQWKFKILKDTRGNEGICLGISLANVRDFSHLTSKDMWLYRSYNGGLYNDGEILHPINTMPEYSADDIITVQVDLDEGTMSFGKNNTPLLLAFDNLPTNVELFPIVVFYTSNHGEIFGAHKLLELEH